MGEDNTALSRTLLNKSHNFHKVIFAF